MRVLSLLASFLLFVFLTLLAYSQPKFNTFFSPQGGIQLEFLTGEFDSSKISAVFNNISVPPPAFAQESKSPVQVLGATTADKRIEVDLTNQRLYAYEGDKKVMDFLVSSGSWGKTPTGRFKIWIKLRYTLMTGGTQALGTYYYLPNVPYTMFFYNEEIPKYRGFGIHGTYWHDNFGHPMSHGCINMKTEEAEQLYYWAQPDLQGKSSINATVNNLGTEIIIYGKAPDY